jgi:hypothetical protein
MVVMNAMNCRPLLGGKSWLGSLSAALALALALTVTACGSPNAGDDESGSDTTADGIGTSPSDPNPTPPPPTPPPGSGKRLAVTNDPTGCPAGMTIILGTAGADVLESSEASTCFVGLGGDDVIFARGPHAVVIAGEGADYVAAQPDAQVRGTADIVRLAE